MNDRKPLRITHFLDDGTPVTALTNPHRFNGDSRLVRTITLDTQRVASTSLRPA